MLIQGRRRWRWSSYRIGTFSGMFIMWSFTWLPGFCCCGRQLLWQGRDSVLIVRKCFCDASSRPSMQSLEPGLVPAKPPTSHLSSLHFYCSQTKKEWKKKKNSKAKLFQKIDSTSFKSQKKSVNNSWTELQRAGLDFSMICLQEKEDKQAFYVYRSTVSFVCSEALCSFLWCVGRADFWSAYHPAYAGSTSCLIMGQRLCLNPDITASPHD